MSDYTFFKYPGSILLFIVSLFVFTPVLADVNENAASLKGLKNVKAVYDITTANPKKLLFYLKLIGKTADTINKQGISTHFVLSFRGPATFYVSNDRSRIKLETVNTADLISAQLKKLGAKPNVKLEQCGIAAHALKVKTKTINKSVKVIGNSWISLIGYQNQGYALVPVR